MGALLVMVFDDEAGSREGAQALRALHAEGAITLYASAIVAREPRGRGLAIREPVGEAEGAAAPIVGAMLGALVALLGGPATAVARTVEAGLVAAVRDLVEAGLGAGYLEQISRQLQAGRCAVVASAEEESPIPLELVVASLGGSVLRHGHGGTGADEIVMREVEGLRRDLAALRQDRNLAKASAAGQAVPRTREAELRRSLKHARLLAGALRREAAAKVSVLRAQAAILDGEARAAVESRAGRVRAALEARASRLDRLVGDVAQPVRRAPGSGHNNRRPGGDF
jgi:uncharacterized membrane protein